MVEFELLFILFELELVFGAPLEFRVRESTAVFMFECVSAVLFVLDDVEFVVVEVAAAGAVAGFVDDDVVDERGI